MHTPRASTFHGATIGLLVMILDIALVETLVETHLRLVLGTRSQLGSELDWVGVGLYYGR